MAADGKDAKTGGTESARWLKELEKFAKGTFWEHLGLRAVDVAEERTIIALDAKPEHLNGMDIVHGGVLASMLDSAMGLAVMRAYPGRRIVTTNLNVHFVAPMKTGTLTAVAEIAHKSRTTITVQASVTDAAGKLGTIGTGSFRLLD